MFGREEEAKAAQQCDELNELADQLANEQQLRAQAEARMRTMTRFRDSSKLDAIALDAAGRIEDFFAQAWDGVGQRKAHIQCLIRGLLDKALTGGEGC
jgi:uncharacterized coiled-coil protein SlyX